MTIPGVNLITAATLVAVIGDVGRFASARKLVATWASIPACASRAQARPAWGASPRRAPPPARHVLCEAAQAAMRTPGPLRAFGQRVGGARGHQVAVVAVARKLASLAWRLLTSGQDYAYANPARVRLKLRRIELLAGAPRQRGRQSGATRSGERERELALAAERAYQRLVADRQAGGSRKKGRGRRIGARISKGPRRARQRGRPKAPEVCALARGHPHPEAKLTREARAVQNHLTFIRRHRVGNPG